MQITQEEKRKQLMRNNTYARIIRYIEGDAEMMHRLALAVAVLRTNPGAKYSPLRIK